MTNHPAKRFAFPVIPYTACCFIYVSIYEVQARNYFHKLFKSNKLKLTT